MIRISLWTLYATLVIMLVSHNLYSAISMSSMGVRLLLGVANVAASLVALFGYLYHRPILQRTFWVALFWINVALTVFRSAVYFVLIILSPMQLWVEIINLLFFLPLLYVLFRYGAVENGIWGDQSLAATVTELERQLSTYDRLQALLRTQQPDGLLTTTAELFKTEAGIHLQIEKSGPDSTETFSQEFPTSEAVAEYLKFNTIIRIRDFKAQETA